VEFAPSEMAAIVEKAEELLDSAKDGPERRGCFGCGTRGAR